ncbi:hypothetical protein BDQ17DRAFT_1535660 [Cyathus striatus]|nr:hypothetical protein BDQ17DRAFT_1535660 [Cyathus striatus]
MLAAVQGQNPIQTSTNTPVPPSSSSQPLQQSHIEKLSLDAEVSHISGMATNTETAGTQASRQDLQPQPLLPAFSSKQYSHLPTPQSPDSFGRYVPDHSYYPESPLFQSIPAASSASHLPSQQRRSVEETPTRSHSGSQQCITPESSPYVSRATPPRLTATATPQFHTSVPLDFVASTATSSSVKLESPLLHAAPPLAPPPRLLSPILGSDRTHRLSSPFMTKLAIAERNIKPTSSPLHANVYFPEESQGMSVDSVVLTPTSNPPSRSDQLNVSSGLTPSLYPSEGGNTAGVVSSAGGEMERIRQAMAESRLAHFRDAESRRPDYLIRAKRALSEADPSSLENDGNDRVPPVGIMESPHKGRRLTLFQETSEESFEESLMAGGYGRYRTAEWVRQPQPLSLPNGGISSTNIVNLLEEVEEPPPLTEKELKKRKRLEAFRSSPSKGKGSNSKLYPVELEGKGRVLLDVPNEEHASPATPEPSPSKKRAGSRRKKKGSEPASRDRKGATGDSNVDEPLEKPNWPDAEFPWRLRTEERAELAKAEEEERMRWIERFLDRDTDDEDDDETGSISRVEDADEEVLPSAKWGMIYEDEVDKPLPPRMGRGKMVPLLAYPVDTRTTHTKKRSIFPSDPADARAALLSKRSVRTLSYRHQRRQRESRDDSDDEVVCICNGRDDGRELVQCDSCETWYHLQCIGIKNIAELGREEDPWYCKNCQKSRSPSPNLEESVNHREPTFVPTMEEPRMIQSYDPSFYQPSLQDSPTWAAPRIPKTPTRADRRDFDPGFTSSSSSWVGSSRHGPSTPQHHDQGPRVYTQTSLEYDVYGDESPFDPTSTPSRGIRFPTSFATPKNNPWSMRANGLFQTPSRRVGHKGMGSSGSLTSDLEEGDGVMHSSDFDILHRSPGYDDSPIRRRGISDIHKPPRLLASPGAARPFGMPQALVLEDSPVMHSKGRESRGKD